MKNVCEKKWRGYQMWIIQLFSVLKCLYFEKIGSLMQILCDA